MSDQNFIDQRKPDISYPCLWEYKVIGSDEQKLREEILTACAPVVPTITLSNVSKKGTYISLNAELQVEDEEMRLRIFTYLQNSPDIKIVI
ncbi:MAG: HP0495 family protein [Desulfocapsaceae bacterium]